MRFTKLEDIFCRFRRNTNLNFDENEDRTSKESVSEEIKGLKLSVTNISTTCNTHLKNLLRRRTFTKSPKTTLYLLNVDRSLPGNLFLPFPYSRLR